MSQMSHAVAGGGATEESLSSGQHKAIFIASFLTLIAAGIGFAVRGAILDDWGAAFGFTKFELGTITGGGLTGFGITIIICSLFADRIGYKTVLTGAFILHVLSALITLSAGLVFKQFGREATYWTLFIGMFIFALGNGLCEAAINPLTATLYPKNKTHYLNILHAGWPAGLVLGAVFAFCFAGDHAAVQHMRWEIPMLFFLVPTLIYGLLVLYNPFPVSEAKAAGVSMGTQILSIFAPLLIFLFLIHGLVGYVELGTDSWITSIMNNVKTTIANWGLLLFIYVSTLMFILRFFAGPIVHRINPLGLLLIAACFGALGLFLLGTVEGIAMIVVAGTVYALGKTFYWPTMLGVIGERFPKGGALAMGISGGIGMISAGMLGGPGIGYFQDRFASDYLKGKDVAVYDQFKTDQAKGFLRVPPDISAQLPPAVSKYTVDFGFKEVQGLDGSKVGVVKDGGAGMLHDVEIAKKAGIWPTRKTHVEAAAQFDALLARASAGEDFVIEDNDKPVASLVPAKNALRHTQDENLMALDKWYKNYKSNLVVPVTVDGASADLASVKKDQRVDLKFTPDLTAMVSLDAVTKNDPPAKFKAEKEYVSGTAAVVNAGGRSITLVDGPKSYDVLTPTDVVVLDANNVGGRMALKVTAFVPGTMAVCYLLLVLFFAARGGYKPLHLETSGQEVAGPTEGL